MSHLTRLIITIIIIFSSIALGYCLRRLQEKGSLRVSVEVMAYWRKRMQIWAIFGFIPLSAMLSLWGLPKPELILLTLPLLGLASYICGGFLSLLAAKLLRLNLQQTGSFYCCGTFTNLGAVGGLVCLLFLGENSIALVALYRLLEEIFYFGVSFPIARRHSERHNDNQQKQTGFNGVLAVIIIALTTGISLNLAGIPRAPALGAVSSVSMLIGTILFLFAIGLTLRLSEIGKYWRPDLGMCAIKFICIPLIIITLAKIIGLGNVENGLPLKTVAILACMPVAMTALVPPSLFDLDIDLANSCWLATTGGLVFVLPALMFILPHL